MPSANAVLIHFVHNSSMVSLVLWKAVRLIVFNTDIKQLLCLVLGDVQVADEDDYELEKDQRIYDDNDELDVQPQQHTLLPDKVFEDVRDFGLVPRVGKLANPLGPAEAHVTLVLVMDDLVAGRVLDDASRLIIDSVPFFLDDSVHDLRVEHLEHLRLAYDAKHACT